MLREIVDRPCWIAAIGARRPLGDAASAPAVVMIGPDGFVPFEIELAQRVVANPSIWVLAFERGYGVDECPGIGCISAEMGGKSGQEFLICLGFGCSERLLIRIVRFFDLSHLRCVVCVYNLIGQFFLNESLQRCTLFRLLLGRFIQG